ncbi:CblD family pilus biogenesis initiator protein [Shimwellia blattae DSM 4481 = NBRC 105725]|nr:CblD family pilus biogenesis initiator protein [Shimwellia blattae DSM 4481 = NBRC 105725]
MTRHRAISLLPATLLSWLLFTCHTARADALLPVDMNTTITISYDRSAPPASYKIWQSVANGYDRDNPGRRARDWFRCKSNTDTSSGACSRQWLWGGPVRDTMISLRMTEQRSKVSFNIPLRGRSSSCTYHTSPHDCSSAAGWQQMTDGRSYTGTNSKNFDLRLEAEDLAKIPTGGIWEGVLILEQRQWSGPSMTVAWWTANITLDVTDRNNGAIYLPAFGRADPLVDLNLRTKPLSTAPGGEVSGSTVIDTCLYDGYNSNNAWLQVTLSDLLPPWNRAADLFSVTKTGTTGGNPRDRVDYRVTMNYNGNPVAMENKKTVTLNGVDTALIRPVALPGFPVTVVCTPSPLTLTVQPFAKASKTAGRYSGTLRVNLAARTLAP